jgi:hypothetical protein
MEINNIAGTYRVVTLLRYKQISPETEHLFCYGPIVRSLDSSVSKGTVYGLNVQSSNPGSDKTESGAHTATYPVGRGVLSLEMKRPGREADHSPLSSAVVKKKAQLYLHSPMLLHGRLLN